MDKLTRVLIISPHPDDEAISCGGLIMKAKRDKAKVFVLYISTGKSRQFLNGETKVDDRLEEVRNAAKYGDFRYKIGIMGASTKLDTFPQKILIELIEDVITRFEPDTVVIPYRNSYNQDHRVVAQAAITALRPLPKELHYQPTTILEMEEPYSWPQAFTPNFYLDITEYIYEKITLYEFHKSQVPDDPFPRSVNNLVRLAGIRGCDISSKYAEAYNLIKGQL